MTARSVGVCAGVCVRFLPSGRTVVLAAGSSLLQAARAADLPLGSSCGGRGACGWCRVTVLHGSQHLSRPGLEETQQLARLAARPDERLACQALVLGPGPLAITTSYWCRLGVACARERAPESSQVSCSGAVRGAAAAPR